MLCSEAGRDIAREFGTLIITGRVSVRRAAACVELLLLEVLRVDLAGVLARCIAAASRVLLARRSKLQIELLLTVFLILLH